MAPRHVWNIHSSWSVTSSSSFPAGHLVTHPQRRCSYCDIYDVHRSPIEELSKADIAEGSSENHGDVRQTQNIHEVR